MDPVTKIHVRDSVLARRVGEELVLLDLDTETYFGLDRVGARMWDVLTSGLTLGQAQEALLQEFEVDATTLERDLRGLLDKLQQHALVEISAE